jgi:hypothetical protein
MPSWVFCGSAGGGGGGGRVVVVAASGHSGRFSVSSRLVEGVLQLLHLVADCLRHLPEMCGCCEVVRCLDLVTSGQFLVAIILFIECTRLERLCHRNRRLGQIECSLGFVPERILQQRDLA